ncbi:hypothetical protein PRUPE_4G253100 [Prunus persica]|uniref:Chalcone/stilbene synthase C-terminal domain-containing protein n=1 Tax=Prunus persica TaxID=3760 RepID=M5WXJ0_PRUPE|nr:hypothetical protein PRUPE_4G253100 [Prunus persica]
MEGKFLEDARKLPQLINTGKGKFLEDARKLPELINTWKGKFLEDARKLPMWAPPSNFYNIYIYIINQSLMPCAANARPTYQDGFMQYQRVREDPIIGWIFEPLSTFLYYLSPDVPKLVGANIEELLVKGFSEIDGINNDWNALFYCIHPGGPAILDKVEEKLGLNEEKLRATRHVLREYGNMGAPSKSMEKGKATTGEGLEWGVLIGIGPGLTVETVVLHSVRIAAC